MPNPPKRILVVGPTGSGKTIVGSQLARVYGLEHVELDALHWGPDWIVRPEFEEDASRAVQGDAWVIDGGYTRVTEVAWPRAELVVWLDYTFPAVFTQLFFRTIRRCWTKEIVFSGNHESWRTQCLSKDSLFLWLIQTYSKRKRTLDGLAQKHPGVSLLQHLNRKQTNAWLSSLHTHAAG